MQIRKKQIFSLLMAFALVIAGVTPAFASNNMRDPKNITIPETNDITIHKLEYKYDKLDRTEDMLVPVPHPEVDDEIKVEGGSEAPVYDSQGTISAERENRLGELDDVNKPGIQNTGDEIDPSVLTSQYTTKAYSPKLYGEVGFSLFKLDPNHPEIIKMLLPDVDYFVDATPEQQKAHSQSQMRSVKVIGEKIEEAFLANSELPYNAKLVETKVVDEFGKLTFEGVKTYDVNAEGELISNHYIIVETKHPELVVGKSNPLFVSLPITNVDGTYEELQRTPYKTHIHLYPKNEVKEQTFVFQKYKNDFQNVEGLDEGVEHGKNQLTNLKSHDGALQGAKFHIYKGVPADFEQNRPLGNQNGPFVVETDANGQVDISGLVRGQYYLVELEVEGLIDGMLEEATKYQKREDFKYLAGYDALNNPYNILTFNVGADGVARYGSVLDEGRRLDKANMLEFINHYVPDFKKELIAYTNNGGDREFTGGWDYFENIPFKVTLQAPDNLWQYSKFEFKDQLEVTNQELTSEAVEPTTHSEFVRGSDGKIAFDIKTDKGETLERGVDFWVVSSNEDSDNNKFEISFANPSKSDLTAETTTPVNSRFSDKVLQAEEIYVLYHAQLNAEAIPDQVYKNRAEFTYNNAPQEGLTKDRYNNDFEEFKTFGRKFIKEDAGLFNTKVGKQPLKGAEFLVKNAEGKYFNGYTHTENKFGSGKNGELEPVWVEFESDQEAFTALRNADNPARKDAILISDENGEFEIRGLKRGTYYLVEINAPTGYRLPLNPVTEFEVGENTWTETSEVRQDIQNEKAPEMPLTGSEKTTIYLALGGGLMAMTVVAYVLYNKKKSRG